LIDFDGRRAFPRQTDSSEQSAVKYVYLNVDLSLAVASFENVYTSVLQRFLCSSLG
jgi:hypothetical protein